MNTKIISAVVGAVVAISLVANAAMAQLAEAMKPLLTTKKREKPSYE